MPLDATEPNYTHMSPTLLAQQPLTAPDQKLDADWQVGFQHFEARRNGMRNWRYSWWTHWSRLGEYFLPRRYQWIVTANRMQKGSAINEAIVDSTGQQAVQTCASGLWTGLTSPSRPWFKLGIGLPWIEMDADGKEWLEDTEQRIYTVLAQSNFYTSMAQAFQDVVVFGTAPMIIYEDDEDAIRCYLPCAGEYYLATGARFSVDTLYREFVLTIAQIVEQFGIANCPEAVKRLWAAGRASLETEMIVCHAIEPNFAIGKAGDENSANYSPVPGAFPYREVYWLQGQKTPAPLSVRGFHKSPFMVARWSTVSNDPYGRSPCMDALGDQQQVQLETRRKAEYIEKGVRPPMGASVDMKNEPASILPANITYVSTANGQKGFWPLYEISPQWIGPLTADIEKVSDRIEKCLFVDLFMAITRMEGVQPRNELELTKRDLERLQALGPFVQMFETEFAGPAIQRVMGIMERRKMLKPMPASLMGVPLKIDYVSIMKLAQRSAEVVAIKDVFETIGALNQEAAAAGLPLPLRVFNLDKAARRYADLSNLSPDLLFTDQEVATHDQARLKAKQAAALPAQAMAATEAAKNLGSAGMQGTALGALTGAG